MVFRGETGFMERCSTCFGSATRDHSSETTIPLWKEAYYSLVLFQKILSQFPNLSYEKDLEDMWEMICELLLHPHIWLRTVSNRLIALYFKSLTESQKWNGSIFLMRPSRLFFLAVSFCSQLKASLTDESAKDLLTELVTFAILRLYTILGPREESQVFWSTLEQKDEDILLRAFVILDSRKGRSMYASLASGLNGHIDIECCENHRYLLISSIIKTMRKTLLDMEEDQMNIVFISFGNISPTILDKNDVMEKADQKDGQTLAHHVLLPLYKICEGFAGKVLSGEVKEFAKKVRNSIQGAIGAQNFIRIGNSIRKNLKAKRDKRKQGQKVMAVVNPEKA